MRFTDLIDIEPITALHSMGAAVFCVPDYSEMSRDQLAEELRALHGQASMIQQRADRENRQLTAAEDSQLNELFSRFSMAQRAYDMTESLGRRTTHDGPGSHPSGHQQRVHHTEIAGMSNRARFDAAIREHRDDAGGFNGLGDFMMTVASGREDRRLRTFPRAAGQGEYSGGEGGYLVPHQLTASILGPLFSESGILSRVNLLPMTSNVLVAAGFNTTDTSSGAVGGLELKWEAEGETLDSQTGVLGSIFLRAKKGAILVECSNELLEDSVAASVQLEQVMRNATQLGLERAILTGNGVGQPRGVLNDVGLVTIAKESGQAADSLVFENIVNMVARQHPSTLANSVWIASPSVLPQLLSLAFPIRDGANVVGGSQVPITVEGEPVGMYRLMGLPLLLSETLPALGDKGDLMLVNFGEQLLGMRTDLQIEMSPHLKFNQDKTVFRLRVRCDSTGRWSGPATPLNGNSLSWAVCLAERA